MDSHQAGDGERFERIVPVAMGPAAVPALEVMPVRRSGRVLAVAFAGLLLILLAVVFWLPKTVSGPPSQGVVATAPVAAPTPAVGDTRAAAVAAPIDVEATLQQRQQAEALAAQWHEQQQKLAVMGVSQWAMDAAAAMAQQAAQADALFIARDFAGAAHAYQQALASAQALQVRAGERLAAALVAGQSALQAGDADAAAQAFSRALRIDANNAEALAGQRHAGNFAAIQAQLNRAVAAESAGDMAAARSGYSQVLALDREHAAARAGLARIAAQAAHNAFTAQMSRGLAALAQRDYAAAQRAFQAALKLRADAPAARDGLAQAQLGLQAARVQTLRERAQQAEAGEQWVAARDAYAAVLASDASLEFADSGRQRAEQRAALAARLQAHIDQPQRLTAPSVRADAQGALADAATIASPGPQLQAQVQQLTALVGRAATPVAVTLRSDAITRVTLYRVGDLGSFASHSLSLLPGQYTAIGRRPGYREVRVAFTVTAQGVADAPLIQCEEPI